MNELSATEKQLWELGDLIRAARERRKPKMRQGELADRVGISRPMVSVLERGEIKNPKIPMLTAIAKALDIPSASIFAIMGINPDDAAPGQLHWLASQLDAPHLRILTAIGHALLQEQHDQLRMEQK